MLSSRLQALHSAIRTLSHSYANDGKDGNDDITLLSIMPMIAKIIAVVCCSYFYNKFVSNRISNGNLQLKCLLAS